jgi:hypothetical protein
MCRFARLQNSVSAAAERVSRATSFMGEASRQVRTEE